MSAPIPILRPIHRWYCPNCRATDVTHEARPHSRMHTCPKLGMLSLACTSDWPEASVTTQEKS